MSTDKRATEEAVVAELRDGMTIGIGGWATRRKPMSLVRAILRTTLRDLTVVSFGGPDVGLLCAGGHVRRVVYGFVSLDILPLEPHFRSAREQGRIEATELDEGMLQLGLRAAGQRLPFLPTRAGLGSDILRVNPHIRTIRSPYADEEELVAMPAIPLDAALVHVNRADARGNGQILGADPFFDDLFLMAADRRYVSAERVVDTARLLDEGPLASLAIHRGMVDAVVEAPRGAHFTECSPDYARDDSFLRTYAASARTPEAWAAFRARYIDVSEAEYHAATRP